MVRGFTDISGSPERRYYIENGGDLLVLRMIESEQFYDREACEEVMRQMADSARFAE